MRWAFFPLATVMSYQMAKEDSINQKFKPVGINNIAIAEPKIKGGTVISYELKGADNYLLSLQKEGDQDPQRFFLASPCKTDIEISNSYCSCDIMHRDYVYTFENSGERIQPIQHLSGGKVIGFYAWDHMNDEEKKNFLLNSQTQYIHRGTTGKGLFDSGFGEMEFIIREDAGLMKEYLKTLFPDSRSFLIVFFNSIDPYKSYGESRYFTGLNSLKEVEKLNKEQLDKFFDVFVSHYTNTLQEDTVKIDDSYFIHSKFEFEISGIKISVPEIRSKRPLLDYYLFFDREYLGALDVSKEQPIWDDMYFPVKATTNKGIFYLEYGFNPEKEYGEDDSFWFKEHKQAYFSWKDNKLHLGQREIDWNTTTSNNIALVEYMLARRLYHTEFFNEAARNAAFRIFFYEGPLDNAVKKCEETTFVNEPSKFIREQELNLEASVPCIVYNPTNINKYTDEGWNDGNNFCFTGESKWLKVTEEVLQFGSLIIGLATIPASGGLSATVITYTIVEVGSIITSTIMEKCGDWPKHRANIFKC
ncbi:MAG: hypothetical protein HQ538_01305 [Parcubacteria group bacterium]|nr:hypothetical protein [Parcubacteria group bacterium]